MNLNILNVVICLVVIIFFSCSTNEKQTCEKCETFFSENDHFEYPERKHITTYFRGLRIDKVSNDTVSTTDIRDTLKVKNKPIIDKQRLLTFKEYEDLKNLLFCFIGRDYDMLLSYFKDFDIPPRFYHNDLPDIQVDYLDLIVCSKKYGSEDIYRCRNDMYKEINLWHTNVSGKYIFLGSKSDSINLQNCIQN